MFALDISLLELHDQRLRRLRVSRRPLPPYNLSSHIQLLVLSGLQSRELGMLV